MDGLETTSYLLKAFVLTTAFAVSLSITFALVFLFLIDDIEKRKMATKGAFVVLIIAALPATWGLGYMKFPLVDQLYDQIFSDKIFATSVLEPANINLNIEMDHPPIVVNEPQSQTASGISEEEGSSTDDEETDQNKESETESSEDEDEDSGNWRTPPWEDNPDSIRD